MMISMLFLMGKQLFLIPHLTSVWEILMRFITHLAGPWCSLFWFCLRAYMLLWAGISYISMKILFVPIQIYNSMLREYKIEVQMKETRKLQIESEKRSMKLANELTQVKAENIQLHELLQKAERERDRIQKNYKVLELHLIEVEEENETLRTHREKSLTHLYLDQEAVSSVVNKVGFSNQLFAEHRNTASKMPSVRDFKLDDPGSCNVKHIDEKYEIQDSGLSSTMVSVFLSMLVAVIVWHAEEPCGPLVVAVFMVACGSLKSVVHSLITRNGGRGLDVLLLFGLNWFILGILTSPAFPLFRLFQQSSVTVS